MSFQRALTFGLLAGVLLTSCTIRPPHHKTYTGASLPKSEVATLWNYPPAMVEKLDGKRYVKISWAGEGEYEILPGKHTLQVGYCLSIPGSRYQSTVPVMVDFEAQAGRHYEVFANRASQFTVKVVDITDRIEKERKRAK